MEKSLLFEAARIKAVSPYLFFILTFAPAFNNNSTMAEFLLKQAASCKAVSPSSHIELTSAPASMMRRIISASEVEAAPISIVCPSSSSTSTSENGISFGLDLKNSIQFFTFAFLDISYSFHNGRTMFSLISSARDKT